MLATRSNHTLRRLCEEGLAQANPLTLAEATPPEACAAAPASVGCKGSRPYDWARIALPCAAAAGFERCLLIRRSRRNAAGRVYCLVFTRTGTVPAELVVSFGQNHAG